MLVRHKNPTFSGTVVVATIPFRFESGVAEVPTLNASHLASIALKGWHAVDEEEPAAAAVPEPSTRKSKPANEYEIGQDVAPEDMEVPEPEIG